jgi:3-hydroxy-5-methyl-1-naphthoate 3-O-methyltransferase
MNPVDFSHPPESDPTKILRYRDGLYAVELLAAAICELDFFTWLAKRPASKEQICKRLNIYERPADVMLTLFAANGFVENRDGTFYIKKVAEEFLSRSSPWNLIAYYEAMAQRPVCKDMLTVLRTGKPATWASYKDEKEWTKAMEQERFARMFTSAMDCRGLYLSQALAKKVDLKKHTRLLDIAGGSGVYACALAHANPHLAATVLEKPPVDQIARETIQARGFSERVKVEIGDMFTAPLPSGYDAHLFSNVLHDWDVPVVKQLITKSFEALPRGGMLVIHDAHLNADKTGPLPVAEYSALLMNVSEGRCYSIAEIETYLQEAGFRDVVYEPTAADRSVVTARAA